MSIGKYISVAMATLLIMGCGNSGPDFTIEGELEGMKGGQLFIYSPSDPNAPIDTLKIEAGNFRYSGQAYDTIPYIILFPNAVEQVLFVSPGAEVTYHAATNDLKHYKVEGTAENELIMQFRESVSDLPYKDIPSVAYQFISDNPQSVVSLYIYDRYFLQSPNPDFTKVRRLQKLLLKHHPANHLLYSVDGMLHHAGALYEGKKIPNISLVPIKDSKKQRKLWAGKSDKPHTLIFFWATWQRNSFDIIYKVRSMQREYGDSIRFVGISLDNQRYRWEDLVQRDSLIIEHYGDGRGWSAPFVDSLSLESLPLYLLVDKKHTIIYKTDNPDRMTDKLKKLNNKKHK